MAFESIHIPFILYWTTIGLYDLGAKYQRSKNRKWLAPKRDQSGPPYEGRQESRPLTKVVVKELNRIFVLKVDDIDWIEAADYYAKIHIGRRSYLIRETLSKLESQLDSRIFMRIHRSTIVNLDRIRELHKYSSRAYLIQLNDGTKLKLSNGRRRNLQQILRKLT